MRTHGLLDILVFDSSEQAILQLSTLSPGLGLEARLGLTLF